MTRMGRIMNEEVRGTEHVRCFGGKALGQLGHTSGGGIVNMSEKGCWCWNWQGLAKKRFMHLVNENMTLVGVRQQMQKINCSWGPIIVYNTWKEQPNGREDKIRQDKNCLKQSLSEKVRANSPWRVIHHFIIEHVQVRTLCQCDKGITLTYHITA